jgi:hypothetical protein
MSRPDGLKLTLLDTNNCSFLTLSFLLFNLFAMSSTTATAIRKVSPWNAYCSIHKDQSMSQNSLAWKVMAKDSAEYKVYESKAIKMTATKQFKINLFNSCLGSSTATTTATTADAPFGMKKNGQPKSKPGPKKPSQLNIFISEYYASHKDANQYVCEKDGKTKTNSKKLFSEAHAQWALLHPKPAPVA